MHSRFIYSSRVCIIIQYAFYLFVHRRLGVYSCIVTVGVLPILFTFWRSRTRRLIMYTCCSRVRARTRTLVLESSILCIIYNIIYA